MSKTILIIGAGIEAVPGIQKAQKMGIKVVASDRNPNAPGFAYADDCLLVNTYDVTGTVKAAKRYHTTKKPINGVMCIASDIPFTVASVADALKLPGISLDSARLAMDKLAMKEAFQTSGVPVPWFCLVESAAHLSELVAQQKNILVVKPIDSRGARGVLRLTSEIDLSWAFEYAKSFSPSGNVMVEKFLAGPQVSTESLMVDGEIFTPGFSDRNYELLDRYAPHIIENGGDMPSSLSVAAQDSVREIVSMAAASIGITNGVVKGDIVVCGSQAYVIEIAARLSGGYFCSHQIPLNTGVDFVKAAIYQALGKMPTQKDLTPQYNQGVSQRFLMPQPGRVVAIENVDKIMARPEVAMCEIRVKIGDEIKSVESHPARAGLVIATGEDQEEAANNAVRAITDIRIVTKNIK